MPSNDNQAGTARDHRVVSIRIEVAADVVYDFARRMDQLPQWASGLASGVEQIDGAWFTESPMGRVQVAMAPRNPYGVLDHDVTLPDRSVVHNAMRVSPAGDEASVVSFVVLRAAGADAKSFEADAAHVQSDLSALKRLLEERRGSGT